MASRSQRRCRSIACNSGGDTSENERGEGTGEGHGALLPVLGRLVNAPVDAASGSPGLGLVLPLLPKTYRILGNPPTFDTVTRDTYPPLQEDPQETGTLVRVSCISLSILL